LLLKNYDVTNLLVITDRVTFNVLGVKFQFLDLYYIKAPISRVVLSHPSRLMQK
jgi:hypothetical protein